MERITAQVAAGGLTEDEAAVLRAGIVPQARPPTATLRQQVSQIFGKAGAAVEAEVEPAPKRRRVNYTWDSVQEFGDKNAAQRCIDEDSQHRWKYLHESSGMPAFCCATHIECPAVARLWRDPATAKVCACRCGTV